MEEIESAKKDIVKTEQLLKEALNDLNIDKLRGLRCDVSRTYKCDGIKRVQINLDYEFIED